MVQRTNWMKLNWRTCFAASGIHLAIQKPNLSTGTHCGPRRGSEHPWISTTPPRRRPSAPRPGAGWPPRQGREPGVAERFERICARTHRLFVSILARGSHAVLHPGKAAETDAGWVGELHPSLLDGIWGAFELDLETLFAGVPERIVYEDVITYPAVLQDVAVAVAEDVEVGALTDAAREAAGGLLRDARVFDVYRGEQVGDGRKSVAIHLAFQSPERTLTEEEATDARERIVAALVEGFGAELRA